MLGKLDLDLVQVGERILDVERRLWDRMGGDEGMDRGGERVSVSGSEVCRREGGKCARTMMAKDQRGPLSACLRAASGETVGVDAESTTDEGRRRAS